MLDGSTMAVTIPTHVSPLQATVISTGPTADCSRHIVCQPAPGRHELHLAPHTAIAGIPMHGRTGGKSKMRATEDPCQLAPLKKRKIQVSSKSIHPS